MRSHKFIPSLQPELKIAGPQNGAAAPVIRQFHESVPCRPRTQRGESVRQAQGRDSTRRRVQKQWILLTYQQLFSGIESCPQLRYPIYRHDFDIGYEQWVPVHLDAPFFAGSYEVVMAILFPAQNAREQADKRLSLDLPALVEPVALAVDVDCNIAAEGRVPEV